jgi:exopolysaccharide production protein ExoQ
MMAQPVQSSAAACERTVLCEGVEARPFVDTAFLAGFFFSFRSIAVLVSARWMNLGTEPGVIATFVAEFALLLMIVFQSIGAPERFAVSITRPARWVMFFLVFAGCSLAWSLTVSKLGSFLYWSGLVADFGIVMLLLRGRSTNSTVNSLFAGFIWSTCALAVIAWLIPATVDLRLGDTEFFNTNQIGNLAAFGIFLAQYLRRSNQGTRHQARWICASIFLGITLLRSLSKTTIIAFVCSQIVLLLLNRSMTRKQKLLTVMVLLAVVLSFWGLLEDYYDVYTTAGNQAETLTGRTAIWIYTFHAAIARPWLGNGFDSMWKVFPPFGGEFFEARHAENEVLQQFFAYGAVGVVMLVGIYTSSLRGIRGMRSDSGKAILGGMVLYVLIRGLAEAEPFDLLLPVWMVVVMSAISGQAQLITRSRERTSVPTLAQASAGMRA